MPVCHCADISISFGHRTILESVNFSISTNDRYALAGANGSGKSTLMKIIAGITTPDSGKLTVQKGTRISYLPQSGVQSGHATLREEAERAFISAKGLEDELRELENALSSHKEETDETRDLLDRHHRIQEQLARLDHYSREGEMHRVLTGLGFSESDFERVASQFSSGWQMRIALAKVLLENPDIMLLDEPTNYLDLEARNWLEKYLGQFSGGVLIVSHDRYFLDANVTAVTEVYLRKLTLYRGNYSAYEKRREAELEAAAELYERQQEEIEKIELFIRRFRYNSSKAKLVQSRIKYLDKLVRLEKPPSMRRIHFSFPSAPPSSECVIECESLSKSYDGKPALANIGFTLMRGERLALLGPNGAGKTTLIKIIAGLIPKDSGRISFGRGVAAGCFLQDHIDTDLEGQSTDKSTTIIDRLESIAPTPLVPKLRSLLGAFLFPGDDIWKEIGILSGGEKSRLLLLELLLHPTNLLLLDEPTNHLDLVSKDILLDALNRYSATIIFVSHDPYFIAQCATKVLELDHGKATYYYGDYDYYLSRKESHETTAVERPVIKAQPKIEETGKIVKEEENKRRNLIKRLERENEQLLAKLSDHEAITAAIEAEMAKEEVYSDNDSIRDAKRRLDANLSAYNDTLAQWEKNEKTLRELAHDKTDR